MTTADLRDDFLVVPIALTRDVDAREEVSEESIEHNPVITNNLGNVKVAQRAEKQSQLRNLGLISLEVSGDAKDTLDGTKPPAEIIKVSTQRFHLVNTLWHTLLGISV